jgi:hypothetical protein
MTLFRVEPTSEGTFAVKDEQGDGYGLFPTRAAAYDEVVRLTGGPVCPDCYHAWPDDLPQCPHCKLDIEDVKAAAEFYDRARARIK